MGGRYALLRVVLDELAQLGDDAVGVVVDDVAQLHGVVGRRRGDVGRGAARDHEGQQDQRAEEAPHATSAARAGGGPRRRRRDAAAARRGRGGGGRGGG